MSHNQLETQESPFLLLPYDLYVNFYFFVCPLQTLLKEGVEKEKTGSRRGRLHPFFISQHIHYSAKKEKSQAR